MNLWLSCLVIFSYDQDSEDYHQAVERVEQTKQKHHSKKNVEVVPPLFNALRRTSRESSQHQVLRKNDGDGKYVKMTRSELLRWWILIF